jgi:tetratricopeptide (TPR) repeat protein
MNGLPLRLRRRLLAAVIPFALSCTGHAQPSPADPLDAAFARMMAEPGNADAALDYARIAASRGETRAAIAALERILRANPSLDNIRLELASLYLAAGSPDVAAVYAREALSSANIPPDVAVRARELLANAEKRAARSLLTGSLFLGPRWDSDATQATAAATVSAFSPALGAAVLIPTPVKAQSGWSGVFNGVLSHRYDLGLQREGSWETNLSGFGQYFTSINSNYNLSVVQFDSGPRVGVGEIQEMPITVRPFYYTNYLAYSTSTYATLYGGGVSAQAIPSPKLNLQLTGSGGFGNYLNSAFRPVGREYTGPEWSITATANYAVTPEILAGAQVFYYGANAQQDFFARSGPGGSVSAGAQTAIGGYPVELAGRLGLRRLAYGAPDPFLNPFQTRIDTIFDAGLSLAVPIYNGVKGVLQYAFYRDSSTYPFYTYNDNAVSFGLRFDF